MPENQQQADKQTASADSRQRDDLPPVNVRTRDPVSRLTMAIVVGFFVLVGYINSIDTGLWLDDHAHYKHLHGLDWSFRSSVETARLGIVGDVMDVWGRRGSGIHFFRPISFWLMKLEYTIGHFQPVVMHGFSLGWHFLCSMLVGAVAMRFIGRRFWATVAASLMAIHPGHVPTVYWVACQTELMGTTFLLLGILAYARHAGWEQRIFVRHVKGAPQSYFDLPIATGPYRPVTLAGIIAIICYALALGCRENTILFPLVCWAGDRLCRSPRQRLIRWEHVAMGVVLTTYMILRWIMLGGMSMPGKPYIIPVSDTGLVSFLVEKFVYYTIGMVGFVPVIPVGGICYLADRPVLFYGAFTVAIAVLLTIWAVYHFRRALLWPMVWMVCLITPVMPVFASSHHLYLPSVGVVIFITAGLAAAGGVLKPANKPIGRFRSLTCTGLVLVLALVLSTINWAYGFAYKRGTLIEDLAVEDVVRRGRPIHDGDYLFFINLPVVAYYTVPAIENELGVSDLKGHVLTFATDLMRMRSPGTVDVLDNHRICVRAPDNEQYFSGPTGRTLLAAMECSGIPPAGKQIDAGPYTVIPRVVNGVGIRELEFVFKKPLDSPEYHFFFGSPQFVAYPLDMPQLTRITSQPTTFPTPANP